MTSRAAYAAHLQGTILPSLHSARDAIARIDVDIKEYEQVTRRLTRETARPRVGPAELGAGVWVDAAVQDTQTITLDLGLDIHLALPLPEAVAYCAQRAEVLKKKKKTMEARADKLRWEAEQFEGALKEGQA